MAAPVRHWRFTVDDYMQMATSGIFDEDDRVELIEGEIYEMSPIGGLHVECVNNLNWLITRAAPETVQTSVQNSLQISDFSVPQPDFVVGRRRDYRRNVPTAADVLLLVEVSDTTLRYDRDVKMPLYAQAGVPEAWIADVNQEEIIAHRDPVDDIYRDVRAYTKGESLSPVRLPELTVRVSDTFGIA